MRLELLGYATESADDAHRRFQQVFEDRLFDVEVYGADGDADLDDKQQQRLQSAKNFLKASLRYLEMFEAGGADNDG